VPTPPFVSVAVPPEAAMLEQAASVQIWKERLPLSVESLSTKVAPSDGSALMTAPSAGVSIVVAAGSSSRSFPGRRVRACASVRMRQRFA